MNNLIDDLIKDYKKIAIVGHVRPDGDCIGASLALYNYIDLLDSNIKKYIYLEEINSSFSFLKNSDSIKSKKDIEDFDLVICLDCADIFRVGIIRDLNIKYKKSICIDHHVSNRGFADINIINPQASSTCEVLFDLLDKEKINKSIAECLYTGIVSDTGIFRYPATSVNTMKIASYLMSKKINFSKIIDDTYITKTYKQQKLLAKAIDNANLFFDNKCIISFIANDYLKELEAAPQDLDGIAGVLRDTKGIEISVFIHELDNSIFKISFRSKEYIDVNELASKFDGGGHIRAAGGRSKDTLEATIDKLKLEIKNVI